jgi:hypothetical protein
MDANKEPPVDGTSETSIEQEVPAQSSDTPEFKIEIKKLEVPIKPRGVLAE